MATSQSGTAAVRRLRAAQAAQRRAAALVGRAQDEVSAVAARRAEALGRLGREEAAARGGLDVALVVLAELVGDSVAALTADVPEVEVRAARRRADGEAVALLAATLREGRRGAGSGAADNEGGDE
ncbi:hypothetical protein [Dactylosporangium sp. NPDC048998]|uniref:hypothetical protein n=1 Tax=Dactylosporangium sp. NPDC048998 TaxID=3363976 RepID=UPI003719FB06